MRLTPSARRELGRLRDTNPGAAEPALLVRGDRGTDSLHWVELDGDPGELFEVVPADPVPIVLQRSERLRYQGALVHWDRERIGFRVELADLNPSAFSMRVEQVLEDVVNPLIASHGGRVQLQLATSGRIEIRMEGGCHGCASADGTLANVVHRAIQAGVPGVFEIVDVTTHQTGRNPFFRRAPRGTELPIMGQNPQIEDDDLPVDMELLRAACG